MIFPPLKKFNLLGRHPIYGEFLIEDYEVVLAISECGLGKPIWLWGDSRIGKTMLARSMPGVHWYMQGEWNDEAIDENADYGVIDDVNWLQLCFMDRLKKVIQLGIPIILISNNPPDCYPAQLGWLEENIKVVHVKDKLYE